MESPATPTKKRRVLHPRVFSVAEFRMMLHLSPFGHGDKTPTRRAKKNWTVAKRRAARKAARSTPYFDKAPFVGMEDREYCALLREDDRECWRLEAHLMSLCDFNAPGAAELTEADLEAMIE